VGSTGSGSIPILEKNQPKGYAENTGPDQGHPEVSLHRDWEAGTPSARLGRLLVPPDQRRAPVGIQGGRFATQGHSVHRPVQVPLLRVCSCAPGKAGAIQPVERLGGSARLVARPSRTKVPQRPPALDSIVMPSRLRSNRVSGAETRDGRQRPGISTMQDGAIVTIWTHDGHRFPVGGFVQGISNMERRCTHWRDYLKRIDED
jgi:hypothetical protein